MPGINEVTLRWTNPENPSPQGVYIEAVGTESRVIALPGAPVETKVSGLRNGVEYAFRVITATKDGSAAPTEWVRATPATGMEGVVAGLIVEFTGEVTAGQADVPGEQLVDQVDLTVAEQVSDQATLVELSEPVDLATAERMASDLAADPGVEWAEPDQFFFTSADGLAQPVALPSDSQYASEQWNLWDAYGISVGDGATTMTNAWAGARGDGVNVAVIDTGITAHPDLDAQLVNGYDFVSNPEQLAASRQANAPPVAFDGDYIDETSFGALGRDANPADPGDWRGVTPVRDSSWHGTQMAGIIAAQANTEGITGIAPNAKVQPIRALSWRGGLLSDIASSITWASGGRVDGAPENATPSKVINMSFAVETMCPTALQQAIDDAVSRGSILVAAAGNANDDASKFAPGNCNGVITVGASNRSGLRADYSNYGATIDLSAPGGDAGNPIVSSSNTGAQSPRSPSTAQIFGTSTAAAHVSAAAAILASRQSTITPQAAFGALTGKAFTKEFANPTCDTSNPDIACGSGILSLAQVAAAGDSGSIDYYMDFNGTNQRAMGATGYYPIDVGSGKDFTFSAWVYDADAVNAWQYIAAQGASAGNNFWIGTNNDDYHNHQEIHVSGWYTEYLLPTNEWVHLAVSRSAGNATFYVNGQAIATTTSFPQAGNVSNEPFRVGSFVESWKNEYWKGWIDQVKVYSTALSATQVADDMQTYGAPASVTSLVAHYDLNEGTTGAAVVNHGTYGSGGNLTPSNSPAYADVKSESGSGVKTVTFPRSYLTSTGGWTVPSGVSTVRALVVGGGGAGGFDGGGGGGGGGVFENSVSVTSGSAQTVTVGMGGNSPRRGWDPSNGCVGGNFTGAIGCPGNDGTSSTFGAKTASGGGGGGGKNASGRSASTADARGGGGGGGGGDGVPTSGGSGVNAGGGGSGSTQGGGGGGAGGAGTLGTGIDNSGSGAGGAGHTSSKSGSDVVYGGGAAGGSWRACYYCIGATASGAGWGGYGDTSPGPGLPNRGGGGGGGGGGGTTGGRGGSGIVIIQYGNSSQTISISSPSSQVFGGSIALNTSGGTGSGAVSYAVTTAGTAGCSIVGTTLTASGAAGTTCGITATKAGDDTYLGATATQTITVTTRPITVTASSPSITVGGSVSPTVSVTTGTLATGNALSGATFTYLGTGDTVYPASTTAPTAVGTYSITPSGATFSPGTASNYNISYGVGTLTISKPSQAGLTITSTAGTYGSPITLTTLGGTGGGGVSYALTGIGTASGCSITGDSLSVTSAGTCLVTATKDGGADYAPVSSAETTVTFAKAAQAALSIDSQSSVTYGDGFTLTTAGGSGGGAVTYQIGVTTGTAHCSISTSPSILTGTDAGGTCEVIATKEADDKYEQALASQIVTVTTRPITVTASSPTVAYGTSFSPSASATAGTLAFTDAISGATYTYAGSGSTVYGPTTTAPTGAGTYSITPSAPTFSSGTSANYAITYAAGTLTINRADQIISFTAPANRTYGAAPFAVAPTSTSGLPVTVTSTTPAVCTVAGNVVTVVGSAIGGATCSLTADQSGDANYNAAPANTKTFTVSQAAQAALTMTSASSTLFGETLTLAAAGGSGTGSLSFSVTSPTGPGLCSLSGTTLTLGDAGSLCKVQATKAASANYLAANTLEQTITIGRADQTLAFTSAVPTQPEFGGTYSPAATAVSTVTGLSSGVTPTFTASGNCTLAGGVVTFGLPGSCVVTASAASSTNFAAAIDAEQTIEIGTTNQNIAFAQPSNVAFGSSSVAMDATTSSGGEVTYALGTGTTGSACSVSTLGVVTILAVGTCEVTASAAAFDQFAAASPVTRAFQVLVALPTAPRLTSASASSQAITVAFTAPGFNGGAPIAAYELVATPVGSGTTVMSSACTASPCTITGLSNGMAYTVTVAAVNSAGTGPASGPSTALVPATAAFAVGELSAVPGDTVVDVSWVQPSDLGGGTFQRYEISYRVAATGAYGAPIAINPTTPGDVTTAATTYRFTGLDNGTSYDFKVVTITTANGSEIPGNTAEVVQYPSTVPTAPRTPTVLAATATEVQFSWSAPLSDGGAPLSAVPYTVTVTSTGSAASVTCTPVGASTTCTASGLTNGATYTFSVVANNRMGSSPAATTTYGAPSADATLSGLVVTATTGAVPLSPAFVSSTAAYTASVANEVSSVTVTPTTTMAASTVTVDGTAVVSGAASLAIPLTVGANTITVIVTAPDPRSTLTYTVVVTRAGTGGGGSPSDPTTEPTDTNTGSGGTWDPSVPETPPATVLAGSSLGGVMLNGVVQTGVDLIRSPGNTGWSVGGDGFQLRVQAQSPTGAPEPLTPSGVMQVPQGGRIAVSGDGYLAGSAVSVFAIPRFARTGAAKITARAVAGAGDLGSLTADPDGAFSGTVPVPADMRIGDYILQVNGQTPARDVRSVNLQLEVVAGAAQLRKGTVRKAAFFQGKSNRLTAEGAKKLRAMVKSIPKNARNATISIIGVSVSMDTLGENIDLAGERAKRIAKYLERQGVKGTYNVTVSTTVVDEGPQRSAQTRAGKPLTTVSVSFETPASPSPRTT